MGFFLSSKSDGSLKGSTSAISGTTGSGDLAFVERCKERGAVREVGDRIGDGVAIIPDGEPLCAGARLGFVASTVGALDSRDVLGCRADSAFPPISRVAEYDRRERATIAY